MIRTRGMVSNSSGFVLVGVVMFVLALSILGLSLFSLSSYEAQFMQQSVDEQQALSYALGGIERAKFALAESDSLKGVKFGLPLEGVVYARARNTNSQDTSGTFMSGVPVEIRVKARSGADSVMLEERFIPRSANGIYTNLITSATWVQVPNARADGIPRKPQAFLTGNAWQNDPDTTWYDAPSSGAPRRITLANVPVPDLDTFFAEHWNTADSIGASPLNDVFDLNPGGAAPVPRFYRTAGPDGIDSNHLFWSVFAQGNPSTIQVSGNVIWMLSQGIHFAHAPQIVGMTGSDCLVIVAHPTIDPTELTVPGIDFFAGLSNVNVRVILVTDGSVNVDYIDNFTGSGTVDYISMFANGVYILGPQSGGTLHLFHNPDANEDLPGGLLDQLEGALPNGGGSGTQARFVPVAGTWREVTETSPN